MVKSDGKLTSVNFYQTEKNPSEQTDGQTENRTKEKDGLLRLIYLSGAGSTANIKLSISS